MIIPKIKKTINNNISNINTKFNEKWINLKNLESIKNTDLTINNNKNKDHTSSALSMSNYIKECENMPNETRKSILVSKYNNFDIVSNDLNNKEVSKKGNDLSNTKNYLIPFDNLVVFDDLVDNLMSLTNGNDILNEKVSIDQHTDSIDQGTIKNKSNEKKEKTNKLPDWITKSGKEELNTNQKLYFKTEKTRSFKNLLKPLIYPFEFINRSLLPIKINFKNKNVNAALSEFKFNNVVNSNDAFDKFSSKLNKLNETFTDNVNQIISKKINNNKKIDIMIKYHTLEKALECKLINDIKLIENELKADLAKNKFQENYSDLPDEIVNKLNIIVNSSVDELFYSNTIDDLKNLIKEKVNNYDKNVRIGGFIDNIVDSIFNKKSKLVMNENLDDAKKELSLNITKELFNYLSKDKNFIGEEESITKIDNLIKMVSKDIYKNMGEPTKKIINSLNNGFYENIKKNDNGKNLLSRIFKNSSNNINYKWAQDAIVLLISYETFENKQNVTTNYLNDGVVIEGGNGTIKTQNTVLEDKLKGIFSRLGLSINDLDKSKDEVLRKYFSNYFEHI
ncbi:hypothetical protein [Proteus sp. TJ1640]|uniref:hypothetical protein n=1 Tax=Proteus sp. TJ1640 TaxID=2050968 RepID=UPI000D69982B|nr:hypothetical protein [Proteus sp. TJ1640]